MSKEEFIKVLRNHVNYFVTKDYFTGKDGLVLFDFIATLEDGKEEEWEKLSK